MVILAGNPVLLVLGPNVNQMVWERLKMPAALELGSEFITQTFLLFHPPPPPPTIQIRHREEPQSSRCLKLVTRPA